MNYGGDGAQQPPPPGADGAAGGDGAYYGYPDAASYYSAWEQYYHSQGYDVSQMRMQGHSHAQAPQSHPPATGSGERSGQVGYYGHVRMPVPDELYGDSYGGRSYGGGGGGGGGPRTGGPQRPRTGPRFDRAPCKVIWVGGLPLNTTEADLMQVFGQFGNLQSVRMMNTKQCAFVNFYDINEACWAWKHSHEIFVRGSLVKCSWGTLDAAIRDANERVGRRCPYVWVGNLPAGTTSTELRDIYVRYGTMYGIHVLPCGDWALLAFNDAGAMETAMREMEGKEYNRRTLRHFPAIFDDLHVFGTNDAMRLIREIVPAPPQPPTARPPAAAAPSSLHVPVSAPSAAPPARQIVAAPPRIPPPTARPEDASLADTIEKTAQFVAGSEAKLAMLRQRAGGNSAMQFLTDGPGHDYFEWLSFVASSGKSEEDVRAMYEEQTRQHHHSLALAPSVPQEPPVARVPLSRSEYVDLMAAFQKATVGDPKNPELLTAFILGLPDKAQAIAIELRAFAAAESSPECVFAVVRAVAAAMLAMVPRRLVGVPDIVCAGMLDHLVFILHALFRIASSQIIASTEELVKQLGLDGVTTEVIARDMLDLAFKPVPPPESPATLRTSERLAAVVKDAAEAFSASRKRARETEDAADVPNAKVPSAASAAASESSSQSSAAQSSTVPVDADSDAASAVAAAAASAVAAAAAASSSASRE